MDLLEQLLNIIRRTEKDGRVVRRLCMSILFFSLGTFSDTGRKHSCDRRTVSMWLLNSAVFVCDRLFMFSVTVVAECSQTARKSLFEMGCCICFLHLLHLRRLISNLTYSLIVVMIWTTTLSYSSVMVDENKFLHCGYVGSSTTPLFLLCLRGARFW